MRCPKNDFKPCMEGECAWYCEKDGCAIKKIAIELTYIADKEK